MGVITFFIQTHPGCTDIQPTRFIDDPTSHLKTFKVLTTSSYNYNDIEVKNFCFTILPILSFLF